MDVGAATFEAEVVQASFEQPVVIDFWAPWCGPCRVLEPVLDALAQEAADQWKLAKINIDEEQEIAKALQISSIPTLKIVAQGREISELKGVESEEAIRNWLKQGLSALDDGTSGSGLDPGVLETAKEMLGAGKFLEVQTLLIQLLEKTPENREALLLLARVRFPKDRSGALALLTGWKQDDVDYSVVASMSELDTLLSRLEEAAPQAGLEELEKGRECFVNRDFQGAVERWMGVVQKDRALLDDMGRRACVSLFAFLGNTDPISVRGRRLLSTVLF